MGVPFYDIVTSIHGRRLGFDESESSTGTKTPYLEGDDLLGLRLFPPGFAFQQGNDYKISSPVRHIDVFDDFVGPVLETSKWTALTGSDGSNSPVINLQVGGVVRLTTGAGSTHTMAVNGSQFVSSRNFLASN